MNAQDPGNALSGIEKAVKQFGKLASPNISATAIAVGRSLNSAIRRALGRSSANLAGGWAMAVGHPARQQRQFFSRIPHIPISTS